MKRHIVVSVKGVEIVNILLEEIDDDPEEDQNDQPGPTAASIDAGAGSQIGFSTPWSDLYFDDED